MTFAIGLLVGAVVIASIAVWIGIRICDNYERQIRGWRKAMAALMREYADEFDRIAKEREETGDSWKDTNE